MRIQATNSNGIGNRFRCFLTALRISESATIWWNQSLEDRVTSPSAMGGKIEPLEELIETDKSKPFDYEAWHVPKFAYFTQLCEGGNRSVYSLLENMDPRAKKAYYDLYKKHLIPTKEVRDLAVHGFRMGFQIRTKSELIQAPKKFEVDETVIRFIKDAHYPIFVACDSAELTQEIVNANPYVFSYQNGKKYVFDAEWKYSMAEILTMASCDTLYITPGSTYGEMGYLFGDYKPIIRNCYNPIHPKDLATIRKPKVII